MLWTYNPVKCINIAVSFTGCYSVPTPPFTTHANKLKHVTTNTPKEEKNTAKRRDVECSHMNTPLKVTLKKKNSVNMICNVARTLNSFNYLQNSSCFPQLVEDIQMRYEQMLLIIYSFICTDDRHSQFRDRFLLNPPETVIHWTVFYCVLCVYFLVSFKFSVVWGRGLHCWHSSVFLQLIHLSEGNIQ